MRNLFLVVMTIGFASTSYAFEVNDVTCEALNSSDTEELVYSSTTIAIKESSVIDE